ncbi:MAG: CBASS cGAMP-activated phospholipase [Planctomycetota bacterium]
MLRILSLSGGGLRGAFAIGVLAELEKRLDRPLTDYFDLIAGTSTGSITAAALAFGKTANDMQGFYEKHSKAIFKPRESYRPRHIIRAIYPALRRYIKRRSGSNLDHFFQSRYCPFALRASMVDGFGEATMRDVARCRLIIPVVNLTDGETYVMHTPHLGRSRPEYDWKVADIIVASAAAPTYFPHKKMPDGKSYADGGLWAIDPGVVALAEAARIIDHESQCCGRSDKLGDVHMLSIGTGTSTYSLAPPGGDAGMLFWARHIAEVMSISQVQGAQLPLKIVLGDRYRHIEFPIEDPSWRLDNIDMMEKLFDRGRTTGKKLFDELQPEYFQEARPPYKSLA